MRDSLIEKTFEWDLTSDPRVLWPFLSDTARLNQALDLPRYRIAETFDRDSIRRRYGEMDEDGTRIRWEEPSFEWVEGGWWRWRRFYEEGPLRETGGILMLAPKPSGGTHVTYTLSIEPNGALGRILVASGHLKIAAQSFEKMSKSVDEYCQKPLGEFYSNLAASGAKKQASEAISGGAGSEQDAKLLAQLGSWLSIAPLADRIDLRSKRLARCLGVTSSEALRACLLGVKGGALALRYRAVCPSCRAGALEFANLIDIAPLMACRRCGAGYRRDLGGSVEALFAVPGVDLAEGTFCGSGPTQAPHMTVQQNVGALERRDLVFRLPAGVYLARAQDGPVSAMIELSEPTGVHVQLTDNEISIEPNDADSVIENHCKRDYTVSIERCDWPLEALPVADLLAEQAYRDLMPGESLADGDSAPLGFGAVLGIGDLRDALGAHDKGALFEVGDGYYGLAFTSVSDAMKTAEALRLAHPDARFAVDCGPLTAASAAGQFGYIGTVPDTARSLCLAGHRGVIGTSARVRDILAVAPKSATEAALSPA